MRMCFASSFSTTGRGGANMSKWKRRAITLVGVLLLFPSLPAKGHTEEAPLPSSPPPWGAHGHGISTRAAVLHLPAGMPGFFSNAGAQLEYLGPEPDRWRSRSMKEMDDAWEFDHYIDLENVPGGMLADRFRPAPMILAGWLLYAAVYAGFAAAVAPWQIWALFGVYGLFYGLTESPEKALVAELSPPQLRGRAFGVFHFAVGLGALPASLLFGVLWQWKGAPAAFATGAGFALLAALLLPLALRGTGEGAAGRNL